MTVAQDEKNTGVSKNGQVSRPRTMTKIHHLGLTEEVAKLRLQGRTLDDIATMINARFGETTINKESVRRFCKTDEYREIAKRLSAEQQAEWDARLPTKAELAVHPPEQLGEIILSLRKIGDDITHATQHRIQALELAADACGVLAELHRR